MVEGGSLKGLGGQLLDDMWDNLFRVFWSNCMFNDIIGILDAKKSKDFSSTKC
jgi:hypothetical protein